VQIIVDVYCTLKQYIAKTNGAIRQIMKSTFNALKLRQIESALRIWRNAKLPPRPLSGWIKAIREALGVPASHLAERLGVAPSTVSRLETSEAEDTITLATLRRAAAALGCELHYALVPSESLEDILRSRANALARDQMKAVSHSMALESQSTSQEIVEEQTRELVEHLLKGSRRVLWRKYRP
jgi:predicted DNA-binding mobile mystery protein A